MKRLLPVFAEILRCGSIAALAMSAPVTAQEAADVRPAEEQGSGPYPATYLSWPSLPDHVVYLPRDLGALDDTKLGIYVFGNGGCSANGLNARNHMLEIASHGYIAIAPGVIPGPNRQPPEPRELPSGRLSADTPSAALGEAIDWAIAQNEIAGSPLQGRVAPIRLRCPVGVAAGFRP